MVKNLIDARLLDQLVHVIHVAKLLPCHARGSKSTSCYTQTHSMPKRFNTKIGPRDIDILMALDRTPLTPSQLCSLSKTFTVPFLDEHNLRRRLRRLADSSLVKSWPYAIVTDGRSPQYFKLTREGYRLLHGADAALPRRRYFEEISHGHHYHTHALNPS